MQSAVGNRKDNIAEWIREKGMNFALKLSDIILWVKGLTGEFTSEQIESENWRWKIFLFLDWCEGITDHIFYFFYVGSREETRAALTLELGEEPSDLWHYNLYQRQLIKTFELIND